RHARAARRGRPRCGVGGAYVGVAVTAAIRPAVRPDQPTPAGGGKDDAIRQSDAYKALPGATYGGGEEAGGLLSKSPWQAGSLLPGTDQASRPSREGTIIAVVIRGDDVPHNPPARRPMAETAIAAGAQVSGGDAMRTQLSQATQRRKR